MASSEKLKSFGAMVHKEEAEELPEEIILDIFSRLPVKSLIRFTCVSKRLRSIILLDPKFAESQIKAARRQKTLNRILLSNAPKPLRVPSDRPPSEEPSSVKKPPHVNLLGSCNGLVFVAVGEKLFYIYNPSTGLLKQLPDRSFSSHQNYYVYGVGYLSATDDYKVLVASTHIHKHEIFMFSLRTHVWERIESHSSNIVPDVTDVLDQQGTLFSEVLHWLINDDFLINYELVCFDLAKEVFRRMELPFGILTNNSTKIGVCGGCLCVSDFCSNSVHLWIMREYDSSDSWTMLYSLKRHPLTQLPEQPSCIREFLSVECSSEVAANPTARGFKLMRTDHKLSKNDIWQHVLKVLQRGMIEYEESLLWISGYLPVEEKEQVQILETHQKVSQS